MKRIEFIIKSVFLSAILSVAFCGCSDDGDETELLLSASAALETTLDGVQYHIVCGADVTTAFVPFHVGTAPSWLLEEGAGDDHSFADLFTAVPAPASCTVTATGGYDDPITGFSAEPRCASAQATVEVAPGTTSEVILVIQCEGDPEGGGDYVTVINWNPIIESLTLDKFVCGGETRAIEAVVSDPELDEVACAWAVTAAPDGALLTDASVTPELTGVEDSYRASFSAAATGEWTVALACTDALNGIAELSFPMHVIACDDADSDSDTADSDTADSDTGAPDTDTAPDSDSETDSELVACNASNAISMGAEQTLTTVSADACLVIADYPPWWTIRFAVVQAQGGGTYPIPLIWTNCAQTGTDQLDQDWDQVMLGPVDTSCAIYIDLNGNPAGTVSLRWWGNG